MCFCTIQTQYTTIKPIKQKHNVNDSVFMLFLDKIDWQLDQET